MQIKLKQQTKEGVKLGCILCGQPPHHSLKTFRDLIIEGVDLTTLAKLIGSEEYRFDKNLLRPSDLDRLLNDLHQKFFQWICQIHNLLKINQVDESDSWDFYHRGGDAPTSIQGISYEKNKDKFIKITETIKNDINITLENLKELGSKKINFNSSSKDLTQKTKNTLITRDGNGDFFYKDKPIKFTNKKAIYYLIFGCLYENKDLEGFCSYETINKCLVKHGKEEYANNLQITNRVKNGIQSLFRHSNLKSTAPDGKEIIQKIRGEGIIFYNPQI